MARFRQVGASKRTCDSCRVEISLRGCQGSAKKLTGVLASALNACCGVILVDFIANFDRENYESKEDRRFKALKHHRRVQGACISLTPKLEGNRRTQNFRCPGGS